MEVREDRSLTLFGTVLSDTVLDQKKCCGRSVIAAQYVAVIRLPYM